MAVAVVTPYRSTLEWIDFLFSEYTGAEVRAIDDYLSGDRQARICDLPASIAFALLIAPEDVWTM